MALIITGLAAAAWAAVVAYNRTAQMNPAGLEATVKVIKQTTGVVLTLANAVQQILNALALIKIATPVPVTATPVATATSRFGTTAGQLQMG